MKYRFSLGRAVAALLLLALAPVAAQAQTSAVGIGTGTPHASAALDVSSTSKGLLPPRLTVAQRDAIASPAAGLTIFNTSTNRLNTWNGSSWDQALSVTEAPVSYAVQTYTVPGQYSYMVPPGITSLNVSVSGAAGGDAIQFGTTTVAYSGGYGGRASATLTVMPGELLVLNVGGAGASNAPGSNGLGGYNGGGNSGIGSGCSECSGAGGGGASDIRRGTTYLVVAGGGGGGGGSTGPYTRGGNGGFGGYPAGTSSAQGSGPQGGGGTQTAGGSGFGPGTMGQGGSVSGGIGGGGGGGYYGGGAATSGGGGGSSYVTPAGNGSYGTASPRGDGSITITPGVFTPIAISNMPGDNLGNHTATQNLNLGFSQLVGNGGATGLAITADGNVGIGTTIPGQKLEVAGNVLISGSGNGLQFPDGTTQRTAVTTNANLTGDITSTGNATSYAAVVPATKGGAGMVSGILKANGNGTVSQAVAGTDYAAATGSSSYAPATGSTAYAPATGSSGYIQSNPSSQQVAGFNISGNGYVGGNVGVGLSIPTQRLDVEGGILARSNGAITNQGAHLQWNRSGGDGETWLLNQRGGGGGGMRFGAATTSNTTTEWARFDGSGNLGLGTPNPNYKLEVNGTALINSGYDLLIRDTQHGLGWYGAGKAWGSATPDGPVLYGYTGGILGTRDGGTTAVLAWNKSGRVGIGTTDPQARLQVNGVALFGEGTLPTTGNATGLGWNSVRPGLGETELYNYRGSGAGGFRFYSVGGTGAPVSSNQVASINAAGVYSALSDRRVKTNITPLAQGLRAVLAMRPVSYDFHPSRQLKDGVVTFLPDDQPVRALGFVAQDLYQVVPEAVEKPKDDKKEFYTVSYTTLVPVLTQAIQEQQAQIEELKKQNAALQTQTKALEARAATAEAKAATTEADHASLLTLQAQMARLLGEGAQARK